MKVRIIRQPTQPTDAAAFLSWTRNILFVIGLLAVGYYGYAVLDARIYQWDQANQFQSAVMTRSETHEDNNLSPLSPNAPSPVQIARPGVLGSSISNARGSVLGRLEIPKISLSVMILEGVDNRTLRRAVGHIPDTGILGQRGNVAIAGHRDTFFRDLIKIEKHDEIALTTLDGSYHYLVDFSEVVGPNDTQVLEATDNASLTLVTCYPPFYIGPAPKRLIVRAHMIAR